MRVALLLVASAHAFVRPTLHALRSPTQRPALSPEMAGAIAKAKDAAGYEAIVQDFVTLQFIPEGVDLRPILPPLQRVFDQALEGGGAKNIKCAPTHKHPFCCFSAGSRPAQARERAQAQASLTKA